MRPPHNSNARRCDSRPPHWKAKTAAHHRSVQPEERLARGQRRQSTCGERYVWMGGSETQQENGDGGAEASKTTIGRKTTGGGSVRNMGHMVVACDSHIRQALIGASGFVLPSDNRVTCAQLGTLGCDHVQPSASYGGNASRVPVSGVIHRVLVLRAARQHVNTNSLKILRVSHVILHVSPLRPRNKGIGNG